MPEPVTQENSQVLPPTPNIAVNKTSADIQSFNDTFAKNAGKLIAQQAQNPYAELQPFAYDPKSVTDINKNYERYYSHPSFKKLGFNPWSDNESLYNQQGTALGDVARAAQAGLKLAVTGFKAPIRSYADIFTGNAFEGDDTSAKEMRYYNTVGSSNKGGFTGFTSNLIVNSGFTLGFMGEAIAEQAALTGLTALTGGGTSGAQVARAAKTVKDFGSYAKIVDGLTNAAKTLNNYPAAKIAYDSFKSIGKFLNPLENTVNALNASKNLTGLATISNTAAGFFRDVSAANFTLSEAKVEGASTEQDLEEELVGKYKNEHNGKAPSFQELLQIKETAKTAGDKTLAFNIPAIYLTNKITFAPLFKRFTGSGEYILKNGAKFIEKEIVEDGKKVMRLVEATRLDNLKVALKPKNIAKIPINYFKENTSEGIQESVQEVISGAAKKYYTDIYNSSANQGITFAQAENQNLGTWDAISQGVKNQFSGKGFETFASGFFMGGLLRIAGAPITAARMSFTDYKRTKNEYTQQALQVGNELYKDPLKWFAPTSVNFSSTSTGVENQINAENDEDQKVWTDFEDQNTWSHFTTALDTGTYDIALDKLKSIKSMTPEAIQEAYGTDGQQVLSKIDRVIARAEGLKSNYVKWNERASNPFNPKAYQKDTSEFNKEAISFASWEAAKKSAVFQEFSFNRNVERINALNNDILQTSEFKQFNPNDISILLDPRALRNELSSLNNELEVLGDSGVAGDRAAFKLKQSKRDRLIDFQNSLRSYYVTQQLDNLPDEEKKKLDKDESFKKTTKNQLKKDYRRYLKFLGAQVNVPLISDINTDLSFKQILDNHDLKQENIQFAQAINVLSNPKGFTDHYKNLFDTFSDLYERRSEIIQKSIEDTQKKIELNVGLLKPLFDRGFVVDSKNLDALVEKGTIPTEFYDLNAKQVVNAADPFRYGQFEEIVRNFKQAAQETPVEESVVEETVPVNPEVVVEETAEPLAPELSIDIVSKFDAVKNEQQLQVLEEEMTALMTETTLEQRNKLGITSNVIRDRLEEKTQQLISEITLANLRPGNIVILVEKERGKNKRGMIMYSGRDSVQVRDLENEAITFMIKSNNLKNVIKMKYSENIKSTPIIASMTEKEKVTQNVEKQLKFTDNADNLKTILEEAYSDEQKFEQDFINDLGCK